MRRRRNGGGATMATQPLDTLSAERWARLREDLRRCELRRGVIIPLAYLEITNTRPDRWTFLARERYAVCPNCAERVAVGQLPARMRCGKCRGVFAMEPVREAVATA